MRLCRSFVPLKLSPAPVVVFALGVERSDRVAIERLLGSDAGKLDRGAALGCVGQKLGCGENRGHVMVGIGNDLAKMRNGIAQCRQPAAILQHNWFGETQGPGHNATPQQKRGFNRLCVESFLRLFLSRA